MTSKTLDAAQAGDEHAFRALTEPYLRELHVHCYRMLGSMTEADDIAQETLIAAWRGLDGFEGRSSLRTWLYRIATNRCLNAIRDGKRRPAATPVPPFDPPQPTGRTEVAWLQPYPDQRLDGPVSTDPSSRLDTRETIELAFITALQKLPPRQTAALLLADVLGFTTAEVADLLDVGPTAAKGLLQRARSTMARRHPVERTDRHDEGRVARSFAEAFIRDDVDSMVALLTDGAWLAMPPAPHEYRGTAAVAGFLRASADGRGGRYRLVPVRVNGGPAFGCYLGDGDPAVTGSARAAGILALTIGPTGITAVIRFLDPGLNRLFGLPELL